MKLLKGFRLQKVGGLAAGGYAASIVSQQVEKIVPATMDDKVASAVSNVAPIVAGIFLHGQKGEFVKEAGNGMVAVAGANLVNSLVGDFMPDSKTVSTEGIDPMLGNVGMDETMIAGYEYGTQESDVSF
jgi:hypothetical protein